MEPLTFLTQHYQLLGLSFAGALFFVFMFKDIYDNLKRTNDKIDKFIVAQGIRCEKHIEEGQHNFEKLELKIDESVKNAKTDIQQSLVTFSNSISAIDKKLETVMNHVIDFFKESKR
jgi:hypothetical protein